MSRKKYFILLSLLLLVFICAVGASTWIITSPASYDVADTDNIANLKICYNANTGKEYGSIETALEEAISGQIIIVMPPEGDNYHTTDNNVASTAKAEYTISRNCTIKSGVSLVIPTDEANILPVKNANNNQKASTLSSYIKSMGEDDRSRGNATSYNQLATSNSNRYLRITINVNDGVTITNEGTLVVSGYLSSGASGGGMIGHTSHSYSRILLGNNAKIAQSGSTAKTYCYGYISEATKNNGSSVSIDNGELYEPFVIDDYRGFSFTWAMTGGAIDNQRSSPFNQFEFRNIDSAIKIGYNGKVYGKTNIYVNYKSPMPLVFPDLDDVFPQEIKVLGSDNDFFIQWNGSENSYLNYKYDTTTLVAKVDFYGGVKLGNIFISIQKSSAKIDLDTKNAFVPLSYRYAITLNAVKGESDAIYNITGQRIKLLPGCFLTVGANSLLLANELTVYSAFYDGTLGDGRSSANAYNSLKYPLKEGATLQVLDTGSIIATNLAGTVYCDTSDNISCSGRTIASKEAWNYKTSGNVNPAWIINDYLEIREELNIVPISFQAKDKIYVGVNTFTAYNSYLPACEIISDDNEQMGEVNQYQKVLFLDEIADYRVEFISNVYRAYCGDKYYEKDQTVSFSDSNIVGLINSTISISNNNNGVNEFNAQNIEITCTTPLVNGQIPLYVGKTISLQADVTDIEKVYNKEIIWSSDDESIATVDQNGRVTGVELGETIIRATCDGVVGVFTATVIPEEETVPLESIVIVCDANGWRSDKTMSGQSYHGSTGNNKNYTFTIEVNPTGAVIASIKWTFTASQAGRQYVFDKTQKTETAEGINEITVHVVSGTGASAENCTLKCEVTDLDGKVFTATFILNHQADVCLVEGTFVMLADGTQKKVEDLEYGDMLLAFNHVTGQYEASPLLVNLHAQNSSSWNDVIYLLFSDGSRIGVIFEHAFFDRDLNQYVYINEVNVSDYIGHRFVKVLNNGGEFISGEVVLTGVEVVKEYVRTFSPVSCLLNAVTEGLLSFTEIISDHGPIYGATNIFEYDENMKYDEEKMQADIEKYGLYTYDDFKDYMTYEEFISVPWAYFKVAVGKGQLAWEDIIWNIEYVHNEWLEQGAT